MRARRDSRELQSAEGSVLASLARGLHPTRDRPERRRVIADGRRLLADLIAADPGRNNELVDASELALLDGDFPGAWQYAERVEALGLGAEYDEGVISAAFATGRDDLIRQKGRVPEPASPAAVALYGALVEALAGNAQLARAHLARCTELKCAEMVVWLPGVLLHRVEGRSDPTALALRKLAEDTPLSMGDSAALARALAEFDAYLERSLAPGEKR